MISIDFTLRVSKTFLLLSLKCVVGLELITCSIIIETINILLYTSLVVLISFLINETN